MASKNDDRFRTSSEDFSSTPHASFSRPEPMDLSAISSINSDNSVLSQERQGSFCDVFRPETVKKDYAQSDSDILYNSYIQWTYLNSCVNKRRKDDERNFMAQTEVLWRENEKLRAVLAELDEEISHAEYLNNLDEMIDTCDASDAAKTVDQVAGRHRTLAESLDTTRHQLPLEGVHLPCDTETYADQLTDTLKEAVKSAQHLETALNVDPKLLEDCTVAATSLMNNFHEIAETLNTTDGLCRDLKRLSVHESSLLVQTIMEKNEI